MTFIRSGGFGAPANGKGETMQYTLGRKARVLGKVARNVIAHPGKPRIFGVGAAKTGTHTLGEMFAHRQPTAHEMDAERLIELWLDSRETGEDGRLRRFLRRRDLKRGLKIDASQVNIYLLEHLKVLFPDSRYVLTVREPRAWLRSIIDDSLRRTVSPVWMRFREVRFGQPRFAPQDAPLQERGLFPLRGYLDYWRHSIEAVVHDVAPDRLLVVRTEDLDRRRHEIADFCGLASAEAQSLHSFANPARYGVLEEIAPDHVDACIAEANTAEVRAVLANASG